MDLFIVESTCLQTSLYSQLFVCFVSQPHADHFDLVTRRMGFIPLPLGSLVSNYKSRNSFHTSSKVNAFLRFM